LAHPCRFLIDYAGAAATGLTGKPLIVEAMLALPANSITLEGEGVVVDDRGVSRDLGYAARAGSK
jgi:hypothetical protein